MMLPTIDIEKYPWPTIQKITLTTSTTPIMVAPASILATEGGIDVDHRMQDM